MIIYIYGIHCDVLKYGYNVLSLIKLINIPITLLIYRFIFIFHFETESCYVARASFKLTILSPQPL
jgi:hypothetical protein